MDKEEEAVVEWVLLQTIMITTTEVLHLGTTTIHIIKIGTIIMSTTIACLIWEGHQWVDHQEMDHMVLQEVVQDLEAQESREIWETQEIKEEDLKERIRET